MYSRQCIAINPNRVDILNQTVHPVKHTLRRILCVKRLRKIQKKTQVFCIIQNSVASLSH